MGLRVDTDQLTGMAFLRTYLEPAVSPARFQPQAHDEVLREAQRKQNAFAKVCFYITANPVRAQLVPKAESWRFSGCLVAGYPRLNIFEDDYWPKFWKIYGRARQPDAGKIIRPCIDPFDDPYESTKRRQKT
jgi:hypothetical protein